MVMPRCVLVSSLHSCRVEVVQACRYLKQIAAARCKLKLLSGWVEQIAPLPVRQTLALHSTRFVISFEELFGRWSQRAYRWILLVHLMFCNLLDIFTILFGIQNTEQHGDIVHYHHVLWERKKGAVDRL
ncbi:hypothetical protein AVEN_195441-1 [Araneus ventricosus]|uniref:Uncharacterized protein n=1 Tax=Araneus ventricosus TaxID=182803 RepID=A0A4Y2I1V3_ARAVE|nr:hypothetical protein AVEN_195441-1 [Araneus ventricosus]